MSVTDALLPFLEAQLGDQADVRLEGEVRRSGGGSSKENWAFDASWLCSGNRSTSALLLRRDPEAGVVDSTTATEFALLQALEGTPVPSPRVRWLDADGSWFDRPAMVVDRAQGSASRAALRESDPLGLGTDGQVRLATEVADVLAQVHTLDVAATGLDRVLADPGPDPAAAELGRWERELDAVELEPQLELRWALRWLHAHLPPPAAVGLVHGDLRPANVLVSAGRLELLLDWELAHLGDPVDDLGWFTCRVYAREHAVPGAFSTADFVNRYAERMGVDVDGTRLHFWQVLSAFRLAVIALTGVRNFCESTTTRPAAPQDALLRTVLRAVGDA
ncbi:MAG: phosphotransferase family protein [Actinomycetota bacterium]|nr:phosphotransferase family protein [Actinomycetota bacterium]